MLEVWSNKYLHKQRTERSCRYREMIIAENCALLLLTRVTQTTLPRGLSGHDSSV